MGHTALWYPFNELYGPSERLLLCEVCCEFMKDWERKALRKKTHIFLRSQNFNFSLSIHFGVVFLLSSSCFAVLWSKCTP